MGRKPGSCFSLALFSNSWWESEAAGCGHEQHSQAGGVTTWFQVLGAWECAPGVFLKSRSPAEGSPTLLPFCCLCHPFVKKIVAFFGP